MGVGLPGADMTGEGLLLPRQPPIDASDEDADFDDSEEHRWDADATETGELKESGFRFSSSNIPMSLLIAPRVKPSF